MVKKISRADKLSDAFLVLGSEYYALARYSSSVSYMPICATLFHHAIELLIKGYLIRGHTLDNLKKIGHDLSKLWYLFKTATVNTALERYNTTITQLDKVEMLRYPDAMVDQGFVLNVRLGVLAPVQLPGTSGLPQYFVNVSDLDDIALTIFSACSVNPTAYFRNTPTELKSALPPSLLSLR